MSAAAPLVWTPRAVIQRSADALGLTENELMGGERYEPLIRYRMVVMALTRHLCGLSYPTTGRVFGRDHTTVHNACKRVADDAALNSLFHRLAERVEEEGMG